MIAPAAFSLQTLAPDEWFSDRSTSTFWLRAYTVLFVPDAKLNELFEQLVGESGQRLFQLGKPVRMAPVRVQDFKVPGFATTRLTARPDGSLNITIDPKDQTLVPAPYVFLVTPHRVNGVDGDGAETRGRLDHAVTLLRLHTGNNLLRERVLEVEVEAADGTVHATSQSFRVPQLQEGPRVLPLTGDSVREVTSTLAALPLDRRSRVELALELAYKAARSEEGFLEYWFAMEVMCGNAGSIVSRLQRAYGLRSHREAENQTGFGVIRQWRHDLVHNGKRPDFSAHIERYLQSIFLDLIRDALGLAPQDHAGFARAHGALDLRPLGLPDCRPEEQKRLEQEASERMKQTQTRRDRPFW